MSIPSPLIVIGLALAWPASAQAETVTIQLTSYPTLQVQHDTPPKGKGNKGDSIDFKDLLVNRVAQFGKQKNKPVAFDAGIVRYTSSRKQEMLVLVTVPTVGTLTYQGSLVTRRNGDLVLPITGGTGKFKGAQGTVTIGPGNGKVPNTFRVTVPGNGLNIHNAGGVR